MKNLVALLIVTNLVCKPCPYCDAKMERKKLLRKWAATRPSSRKRGVKP